MKAEIGAMFLNFDRCWVGEVVNVTEHLVTILWKNAYSGKYDDFLVSFDKEEFEKEGTYTKISKNHKHYKPCPPLLKELM